MLGDFKIKLLCPLLDSNWKDIYYLLPVSTAVLSNYYPKVN